MGEPGCQQMAMESTMERPRALNCRFQAVASVQWCIVEVVLHRILSTLALVAWYILICYGIVRYGYGMNVQWIGFRPHWVGPPLD